MIAEAEGRSAFAVTRTLLGMGLWTYHKLAQLVNLHLPETIKELQQEYDSMIAKRHNTTLSEKG